MSARSVGPIGICFLLVLLGQPWTSFAQQNLPQEPALSADETRAELARVQKEIEQLEAELYRTPSGKKIAELEAELLRRERAENEQKIEIRQEINLLRAGEEVKSLTQKSESLNERLKSLVEMDYAHAYQEGLRRARQKHLELERFAVESPRLQSLGFTVLNFPRIDGSTSTQPLAALIACHAFRAPREWVSRDQPVRDRDPYTLDFSDWPEAQLAEFKLTATGQTIAERRLATIINHLLAANASTHDAYLNVIEGRSDVGLICRPPSADELVSADKAGVELSITPCALDALVFIVNEKNPVTNLTTQRIREIYSGKNVAPFTAYQRPKNSGSQELMISLVMKDVPLYEPKERYQQAPQAHESLMSSVFLNLTRDESGLAYSVWYYEQFMIASARTKMISVDGVLPTVETIRQRRYPYVAPVMFVTRKGLPADSPTMKLQAWLLSPEGQAVVKQSGYAPLARAIER